MNYKRILLIRLSSLGDIVLTSPAIRATRKHFPNAHITMLVGKSGLDVVSENPHLDKIITFDRKSSGKDTTEMYSVVKELKRLKIELSIDFQRKFRTSLLAYLSGAKERIGFHKPFGFLCSIPVPKISSKHAVDCNLELLEKIDIKTNERELEMFVSQSDRDFAANILPDVKPIVGIFPGAGWKLREWMPERFAEVANRCVKNFDAQIVVFGGPKEKKLVGYIKNLIIGSPIIFSGGLTISQLAALIERCNLFISNDTGPMHISVAMKTSTIALFGPGNHIKFQPIGDEHEIIRHPVPCSPCKQFTTKCKDNICMKSITVDEVWQVCKRKLIT